MVMTMMVMILIVSLTGSSACSCLCMAEYTKQGAGSSDRVVGSSWSSSRRRGVVCLLLWRVQKSGAKPSFLRR